MQDPKIAKIRHLGTIAQICRATSSQLRKKTFTQQCLPHMSSQYGELRHTSGWDLLASLGHPTTFQWVSRLGSVTARHSSSGRQPNFVVLNRGRHLYSAGRPSRWALAHIVISLLYCTITCVAIATTYDSMQCCLFLHIWPISTKFGTVTQFGPLELSDC